MDQDIEDQLPEDGARVPDSRPSFDNGDEADHLKELFFDPWPAQGRRTGAFVFVSATSFWKYGPVESGRLAGSAGTDPPHPRGDHARCWIRRRGSVGLLARRRRRRGGNRREPRMIEETERRGNGRGRVVVADLAGPVPLQPQSIDGITCSLALYYLRDWWPGLRAFATALRPGGWVAASPEHPFGPPLLSQMGGYFDAEMVTYTWRKDEVEVTCSTSVGVRCRWSWRALPMPCSSLTGSPSRNPHPRLCSGIRTIWARSTASPGSSPTGGTCDMHVKKPSAPSRPVLRGAPGHLARPPSRTPSVRVRPSGRTRSRTGSR